MTVSNSHSSIGSSACPSLPGGLLLGSKGTMSPRCKRLVREIIERKKVDDYERKKVNDYLNPTQLHECVDVLSVICGYLEKISDVVSASAVSKGYHDAASGIVNCKKIQLNALMQKIGFGRAKWRQHFGEVGKASLSLDWLAYLEEDCPFTPGMKRWETHRLFLKPQTLNREPLTVKRIGDCMAIVAGQKWEGFQHRPDFYDRHRTDFCDIMDGKFGPSHWVCMYRKPPRIRDLFQFFDILRKNGYASPNVSDCVVANLLRYVETGHVFPLGDSRNAGECERAEFCYLNGEGRPCIEVFSVETENNVCIWIDRYESRNAPNHEYTMAVQREPVSPRSSQNPPEASASKSPPTT